MLKFCDLVGLQNCLFMVQLELKDNFEKSFVSLKYCGDNHSYQPRTTTIKLLDTPLFKTENSLLQKKLRKKLLNSLSKI